MNDVFCENQTLPVLGLISEIRALLLELPAGSWIEKPTVVQQAPQMSSKVLSKQESSLLPKLVPIRKFEKTIDNGTVAAADFDLMRKLLAAAQSNAKPKHPLLWSGGALRPVVVIVENHAQPELEMLEKMAEAIDTRLCQTHLVAIADFPAFFAAFKPEATKLLLCQAPLFDAEVLFQKLGERALLLRPLAQYLADTSLKAVLWKELQTRLKS